MTPEALVMVISTFRNVYALAPIPLVLLWEQWKRQLGPTRPPVASVAKELLGMWSPALYRTGCPRKAANVVAIVCLVLDIDDGSPPELAMSVFEGFERVLHGSFNHQRDKHGIVAARYRLILPLAFACPVAEWARLWRWGAEECAKRGITVDAQCKNPDRVYAMPAMRDEAQPWLWLEARGRLLDWRTLPLPSVASDRAPRAVSLGCPPSPGADHRADVAWFRAALARAKEIPSMPDGKRAALLRTAANLAGCLPHVPEITEGELAAALEALAEQCALVRPESATRYRAAVRDGIAAGLERPHPRVPRVERPRGPARLEGPRGHLEAPIPVDVPAGVRVRR